MIQSYIVTAWRNLIRHKLLATINIVGLSVSISVGLLIVSFVLDLLSYDSFHTKSDRTYRVVTTKTGQAVQPEDYASSSARTGNLIRESDAGVEYTTIVRTGSDGDISIGEKTVSIATLYADNFFFDVFDFELAQGDRNKALVEPNSIVLTEKARTLLFGDEEAIGKQVRWGQSEFVVTGVLGDIPHLTHLRFEALVSYATAEIKIVSEPTDWTNIYSNYVYVVLNDKVTTESVQSNLDKIAVSQNILPAEMPKFTLSLQPLTEISMGRKVTNQMGPVIPASAIWILIALGLIVIISSCFNYTNLSIARALNRSKEVGIRKVTGALRTQVLAQFLTESIIISLTALVISFLLYLLIRPQFLSLHPFIESIVSLKLTLRTILCFLLLGVAVGVLAGILPAVFFSNINLSNALKGMSPIQHSRTFGLRKIIIVIQYVFSFVFITTTAIGYVQYKSFLSFDLGFTTDNVLNIQLQGNKPAIVKDELLKLGEVSEVSQSLIVVGLGSTYSEYVKVNNGDSTLTWMNIVDEKYLPLHHYKLIAGRNFDDHSAGVESEAIVTALFLKRIGLELFHAIGEVVKVQGKDLAIIGVVKDFHYETFEDNIEPVMFRYGQDMINGFLNAKVTTTDIPAIMSKIENAWKKIDKVHPVNAAWYDDQVERSYSQYSMMIKVISFLAVIAISIASLGLLGMVALTTETRLREVSIRKILGAGEGNLVLLMSRSFLVMLFIAALIALPATYLLFEVVILSNVAYHVPVGAMELFASVAIVAVIAFAMIGSQALRAARTNPSVVLRTE